MTLPFYRFKVPRSDINAVRGAAAGEEEVSVTLLDPQHAEDSASLPLLRHSIVLIVMEAFSLTPQSPVLLLPRAVLQFGLRTFRKGVLNGRARFTSQWHAQSLFECGHL